MQNAAGDGVAHAPHDQKSLRLIERTIAKETLPEPRRAAPRVPPLSLCLTTYLPVMKAVAALQACDVNLGIAPLSAGFQR